MLPFLSHAPQATSGGAHVASNRIAGVDYAKGICIVLMVMFQTASHYREAAGATGWMARIIDWSRPLRRADALLTSGLFLLRTMNAPLRD